MVGYDHQGEEAVVNVAYFKIICAISMGVERRDKDSALSHITFIHDSEDTSFPFFKSSILNTLVYTIDYRNHSMQMQSPPTQKRGLVD